ncbi:MAG TPA: PAS domain-containing protein, partial [Cytophagales bacterium]|nr:PAS domain-containing protein [Cytophagales bacterium]
PYTKIDLISCRNLLLYLNYHSQKKLFSTLHYSLNLNGFFFFGPNENIGKLSKHLREIDKTWKIYKNIEAAKTVGNVSYTAAKVASKTSIAYQALSKPVGLVPEHQVNAVVELLLKEFGYDTAIHIDEQFTILHTWGDLDKYLLPKRFNFNLLELLPDVLCVAVGTSVRRSVEEKKKMVVKDVVFQEEAHTRRVDVLVQPIMSPKDVRSIVILFSEHTNSNVQIDTKQFVISDHTSQYVAYLERKLKTSSQELDIALERIQHFNDHAQAYHEELVSSNEEMQSTNEELQSVNEELYTVNHELQAKIKELSEINDDFDNYFRNNVCGQIFVDRNLIIKKFTPATTRLIHLVEADLGKSLMDISIHINFENMIGDIRKVISELKVYEREVQNHEGRWYQMTILPYVRKPKNKIDGAVITFYEITTFKKELEEAIASREHALALKNVALLKMNTDLDGFVHMAAHDLQSPVAAMENLLELATRNPLYNDPGIKSIFSDLANVCGDFKKTVEALTDISKIKKSSYEDISHISLQGITDEVKLYLKDLIQRNDAVIHVDFQRCPVIMFSHANLRTVLCHLINNAITYRSEDRVPEIFIKSYVTEGYNVISIKDNGVGIDSRHSSNLFSMYKRFHKHVKGNGLGLYIVKKIIDHAGGRILVETEVGKGSTFRVLIKSHKMDSL